MLCPRYQTHVEQKVMYQMSSEPSFLPSRNLQIYYLLNLVRFLAKPDNIPDVYHLETLAVPELYTLDVDLKVHALCIHRAYLISTLKWFKKTYRGTMQKIRTRILDMPCTVYLVWALPSGKFKFIIYEVGNHCICMILILMYWVRMYLYLCILSGNVLRTQ